MVPAAEGGISRRALNPRLERGAARPAPESAERLRTEYDGLVGLTESAVADLISLVSNWDSNLWRMFRRTSLPDQALCDDIATLAAGGPPLLDAERAALKEKELVEGRRIRHRRDELMTTLTSRTESERATCQRELADAVSDLDVTALPCNHNQWTMFDSSPRISADVRLGEFMIRSGAAHRRSSEIGSPVPATLRYPLSRGLIIDGDTVKRTAQVELARSLCLRLLAAVPPGKLRFTFVDPVALGQSVADFQHLADFDRS